MEKINKIRSLFSNYKLDGYLIPKNDEFFGEYVREDKDNLKFITNFSGSFGFAIILKKKNFLFVDGRYTTQAEIQSGKNFKVITIPKKFPHQVFPKKSLKIGFDPKLHTESFFKRFFVYSKCMLIPINTNLVDAIKPSKKMFKINKFFTINKIHTGLSAEKKINHLTSYLKKKKIDLQLITSVENISWLLNIRGKDSEYTPTNNCFLLLDQNKKINLFVEPLKVSNQFKKKFKNIRFNDINNLKYFLSKINNKIIQIDSDTCSIFLKKILNENNKIIEKKDLIYELKAAKTNVEILNTKKAHIADGVALTKFLFWVKKNYLKKKITELSAENKLHSFRKKNKNFKSLSFPTISGTRSNGAIIHYRATKKTNKILKKGDIYLVDSGGQYNYGTTDVTRTISLNNNNKKIKNIFTRVLKGHIAVASFKLKTNSKGDEIDKVARKPLKQINLDYAHGTGHGVGYFLNVHEGPQGISRGNKIKFKRGMIVSNEPGFYKKNKFGIRIENLIYVKKNNNKLKFENLTLAPIDKNLIEKSLLSHKEVLWINNYHKKVFNSLKKFMNKSDLKDLKKDCSFI